jgi:hypothetical protein
MLNLIFVENMDAIQKRVLLREFITQNNCKPIHDHPDPD